MDGRLCVRSDGGHHVRRGMNVDLSAVGLVCGETEERISMEPWQIPHGVSDNGSLEA